MHTRKTLIALAIAALSPYFAGTASAQDSLTDIGTLGGTFSWAYGVSADGTVVVGEAATAGNSIHAYRWTNNVMTDLGTLGSSYSAAYGVSADGSVVVGFSAVGAGVSHAFRWSNNAMTDLGTLGGDNSVAKGVSADGAVVVGHSQITNSLTLHAYRWTNNVMTDLGTLGGPNNSHAYGVSANGAVVVGDADTVGGWDHAFRWTNNVMTDLGTLGGNYSSAYGVSADGAVVVGSSDLANNTHHAFRWTNNVMADLGTLGGTSSVAAGVSADGRVVVGGSPTTGDTAWRAFRWTSSGMQSVENWLRAAGVTVPTDITLTAYATNSDGSVVVGELETNRAFVARVATVGSGLVTLADVQQSLAGTAVGGNVALGAASLVINGAHSRPLARRVAAGQKTFWLAGDWGKDDHGGRNGDLGLAEVGFGRNLGFAQVNLSLGQTWAKQNLALNGQAKTDGTYLLAELLLPVGDIGAGKLWATIGGYGHWASADLRRGYLNAGVQTASNGAPDVDTWGLRVRLDWDSAWRVAGTDVAPYVDLSYSEAKLAAYTETGGGFPARFNARKDNATELRLGVSAAKPISGNIQLVGLLEAAHRFERNGARTSGDVIGLFGFDLAGTSNQRDWLRAGVGLEGQVGAGKGSLMVNATTKGEVPNYWLAVNWQMAF